MEKHWLVKKNNNKWSRNVFNLIKFFRYFKGVTEAAE